MRINDFLLNDESVERLHCPNRNVITFSDKNDVWANSVEFIRFEEKREKYTWVHPDEIYFAISSDHYVKTLINCGNKFKWMNRHSTLKELLHILPGENFMRLNKFYILNLNYFSHINENKKHLCFIDDHSIPIPHRISPFICRLLKNTYTWNAFHEIALVKPFGKSYFRFQYVFVL